MVTPKLTAKNGGAYVKLADRPDPSTMVPLFELEPLEVEYEKISWLDVAGGVHEAKVPVATPANLLAFEVTQMGFAISKLQEATGSRFSPINFTKAVANYVAKLNEYNRLTGRAGAIDGGAVPGDVPGRELSPGMGEAKPVGVAVSVPADNPTAGQGLYPF